MYRTTNFHECVMHDYFPGPVVNEHVHFFMEVKGSFGGDSFVRLLPANQAQINFNFNDDINDISLFSGQKTITRRITITGIHTGWIGNYKQNFHFFNIQLHPQGLKALFGSTKVFTDSVYEGDCVNKRLIELHEKLAEVPDFKSRVAIAESWVWKMLISSKYNEDTISRYVQKRLLDMSSPAFRELERKTGYCLRTLQRRFSEHFGITMKEYSDIARLQNILLDLAKNNYEDMLDLVVKYNFSSLAHFSSTIHRFTGYSPTKLAADFLQQNADKVITAYLQQR